jgi:hypothetical protein
MPSTSGLGNDVRSILMEIKDTFTYQINDLRDEVQTKIKIRPCDFDL